MPETPADPRRDVTPTDPADQGEDTLPRALIVGAVAALAGGALWAVDMRYADHTDAGSPRWAATLMAGSSVLGGNHAVPVVKPPSALAVQRIGVRF